MVFNMECPVCKKTKKYRMLNADAQKMIDDTEMQIKCCCSACGHIFIPDSSVVSKMLNAAKQVVMYHGDR